LWPAGKKLLTLGVQVEVRQELGPDERFLGKKLCR